MPVNRHDAYQAEDGTRTRDLQLGKLMFYQLNYFRNFIYMVLIILKPNGILVNIRGIRTLKINSPESALFL